MRSMSILSVLFLVGCTADAVPGVSSSETAAPKPSASSPPTEASSTTAQPTIPPTQVPPPVDYCASDRFVLSGRLVLDNLTANVWYATDIAAETASFDPVALCAALPYPGMRPPTSYELLQVTLMVPHPECRLPTAFHAVFSWTDTGFFDKSPRPIVTKDGCVDLFEGAPYTEACSLPGTNDTVRSVMCVR